MTDRDKELEDLQRALRSGNQGTPHLEKPDTVQLGEGDVCFLDKSRPCNGSCAAYQQGPNAQDRCVILENIIGAKQLLRDIAGSLENINTNTPSCR